MRGEMAKKAAAEDAGFCRDWRHSLARPERRGDGGGLRLLLRLFCASWSAPGAFKKLGRDRYRPGEVLAGYIAHLKDEERRSTKTAEARRVLEARAREIEIRNAMREGRLDRSR